MPNLVVRITDSEMAALEAAASRAGQSKSEYVRETLELRERGGDMTERVTALEDGRELLVRRLARLEEMVGF